MIRATIELVGADLEALRKKLFHRLSAGSQKRIRSLRASRAGDHSEGENGQTYLMSHRSTSPSGGVPPPETEGVTCRRRRTSARRIISLSTPSRLPSTSLFQKRATAIPFDSSHRVRRSSCARPIASLCCPPSTSTAS